MPYQIRLNILTIYWGLYDSTQELICNEGQDLKFIGRNDVDKYSIPSYLIELWDCVIKKANNKD